MMLSSDQFSEALRYNAKKVGVLYDKADLPWPWNGASASSFVWATAFFQVQERMKADGKLGTGTLRAIKRAEENTSVEVPVKPELSAPKNTKHSNAVVVNGERVKLPQALLDAGISASNYLDDGEPHFKHRKRTKKVIHFVLHETCGNTAEGCKKTIKKKGYGVQLILSHDGHLSCHGDLVLDRMVHANQVNDTSFGVEVVNPYAPKYIRNKSIWHRIIKASWWTWCPGKDRRYVTPTESQMATARLLVPWLCEITGVPYRFPTRGLNKKKRRIDGLITKPKARPGAGVVAHRDFSNHADGRYMLEDLIGESHG